MFFILLGCTSNTPNLDGHWHLTHESGYPPEYGTIDISDTIIIWSQRENGDYYQSKVDKINKKLFHSFLYIPFEYNYKIRKDSLWLRLEGEEKYKIFGVKVTSDCSLETDYFYNNIIDLNLPSIKKSSEMDRNYFGVNFRLYLGKPKLFVKTTNGDSISLATAEKVVSLNYKELQLTNMKHDIKLPLNRREGISTLIFADSNVPMQKLDKSVTLQRLINSRKIFLVGKSLNEKGEEQLSFLLLEEEFTYDKNDTVNDWLKLKE